MTCGRAALFALALFAAPAAQAVTINPVYSLSMLGGQYFYGGQQGALTGNFSALAAPAMRLNDEWDLFPTFTASYQGTKQVVDLVGAGTLFQEQMDCGAGLKPVYTPGWRHWKLKPSYGFRSEFLKETKDENWGQGLFDYRRHDFGVEAEYVYRDPFSLRAAADYSMTSFPNYSSLESKAAFELQGKALARELVGDKILDSNAILFTLAANAPWRKAVVEFSYSLLAQGFPNQHVVDETGNLVDPLRSDIGHILGAGVKTHVPLRRRWGEEIKMAASFDAAYILNTSNQNNYDALRMQYQSGYYDYSELRLSPAARFMIGNPDRPVTVGLSTAFWLRSYPNRMTQNSAGAYQPENLSSKSWMLSASVSRPIATRVKVLFNFQYGAAYSNQKYESFYKYSYSAVNYLFGVSYDY
ncbi:MAG: hypothetical protein HY922_14065 [Elusimicrobia bacterium]|nr:hypothetical protein [Elusimicrobiota bacterium]